MHRSEIAKREEEMKAFEPDAKDDVLRYLRMHPEDVFMISDLRAALYPDWAELEADNREPKFMALLNVLDDLVNAGIVERIRDCAYNTYYGLH
ncbi:MAG: hypothetical protein Q7S83_03165 [bacterium]|nr:hypothetical protein [bacterium]